ncbi:MAG: lipid-A-disaccharide synthase [Chlamydiota bacterium]|nr:lipid-A-disaccharide synthase [Chlamydiota bacterium]
MMSKKIMMVAGEHSGDRLGGMLAKELYSIDPRLDIFGMGGVAMKQEGVHILADVTVLAVIGLGEAVKHYRIFRRIFYQACQWMDEKKPDLLVLIDFPGFNLRLAKEAKKRNIRVIYYVSPQFWAWGQRRIHIIKSAVYKMIVILPFEKAFYDKHGIECEFVGHPLVDQYHLPIDTRKLRTLTQDADPVISILPGSRMNEINRHLDILVQSARLVRNIYPKACFLIPCASEFIYGVIRQHVKNDSFIHVLQGSMRDCLEVSQLAWVCSGTATLETGVIGVPMIVIYKVSKLTAWLARILIKVPYIGLVNLVAGKRIVPELLQKEVNPNTIKDLSVPLIEKKSEYEKMHMELSGIREKLGAPGASRRAAKCIMECIEVGA